MEFKKIEGSRKGSFTFCANGYIYTKNNEYKGKINLRCHSYKKGCCGTVAVENGNFSKINPTHPKNPDDIQKIKIYIRLCYATEGCWDVYHLMFRKQSP